MSSYKLLLRPMRPPLYSLFLRSANIQVKFARENRIPLTVRGGAHSASGASSIDGGLISLGLSRFSNRTVDLSRMRKVTVDPEKKQLIAQGGALISDLDQAAAEYGLATGISLNLLI